MWWTTASGRDATDKGGRTPGGIPVAIHVSPRPTGEATSDPAPLRLHLEYARLKLLRGFEELLCLEGLHGVEHLPHQIETVRKVLRHFRGRVLLADEVGLGKTIEAGLLLREYLLRGLVKRVLILVPASLVPQWQEELSAKFSLAFSVASRTSDRGFWQEADLALASLSLAKSRKHFDAVTALLWDLVIVDEAHHCKNRSTRNWQLVNAVPRRHLFLLTATPVQNDLVELYNLLTLLEPGHLRTERDFKKTYVRRGHPRDPRNRQRLRSLLGQVMVRNTRSLVNLDLPPRYAQTFVVTPAPEEARLYQLLESYLRSRARSPAPGAVADSEDTDRGPGKTRQPPLWRVVGLDGSDESKYPGRGTAPPPESAVALLGADGDQEPLNRMQVNSLLLSAGSHPSAFLASLDRMSGDHACVEPMRALARRIDRSAKEHKLLELLRPGDNDRILVFANFRATLDHLSRTLTDAGIPFSVFSGSLSGVQKERAVEEFRTRVPVMLCSESGGEGFNLQFANTLVNFDLPWNPMRIEQRVGRLHRIGQTREVFVFNLCTAGSIEERILRLLNDKVRMFELVVGEVGSILGNLDGGDEFESLVLNLWLRSRSSADLEVAFEQLGQSLLEAQEEYVKVKELDEALFGQDYE